MQRQDPAERPGDALQLQKRRRPAAGRGNRPRPGSRDPIEAIAERYLRVTCACMTPNTQRFTDLERLARDFAVDGVLDLSWQFCQPFELESHRVKELVCDRLGLPFLHVVTDYSQSDIGQLHVRIEGFLEQIAVRRHASPIATGTP